MSRLNKAVKQSVVEVVVKNAASFKDKDIVEVVQKELGLSVSLGLVRKIRQDLGIVKSPGRGVCKILANETVPSTDEQSNNENKVPF